MTLGTRVAALVVAMTLFAAAPNAWAHCDTLNGPVVAAARAALQANDVTPVLKWIQPAQEAELRAVFTRTTAVRALGSEARELADRYFFETLVRLHRAGEGEPYTGIKDDGDVDEAVEAADKALDGGEIEPLVALLTGRAADGIHGRFARARELRRRADDSIAAGRKYVAAYVELIHYVEQLNGVASPLRPHE